MKNYDWFTSRGSALESFARRRSLQDVSYNTALRINWSGAIKYGNDGISFMMENRL